MSGDLAQKRPEPVFVRINRLTPFVHLLCRSIDKQNNKAKRPDLRTNKTKRPDFRTILLAFGGGGGRGTGRGGGGRGTGRGAGRGDISLTVTSDDQWTIFRNAEQRGGAQSKDGGKGDWLRGVLLPCRRLFCSGFGRGSL